MIAPLLMMLTAPPPVSGRTPVWMAMVICPLCEELDLGREHQALVRRRYWPEIVVELDGRGHRQHAF